MPECRRTTRNFQGRGSFVELGHFDKHFVKNTSKKTTQLHRYILNGKFTPKMDTISDFYLKSEHFFNFQKTVARLWM